MEADLGTAFDALPAMVWTALPDGRVDFVNRRWSEYTGFGFDGDRDREWQAAVDPGDLPGMLERWRSILASGEAGDMEARLRRFDGQYRRFVVHGRPMRDDAGRITRWCAVATDVEDLRRAEESLRRRELDFRLVVDSIPVPVAVTTPSGEVEALNRPTLDYFGEAFEDLKGWKTSDVVHPDDLEPTIARFLEAHRTGTSYSVESRHRRADGVYRWFNVIGLPLRDPQGHTLRWFHLLIDIDDRKRAEDALRARDRDDAKRAEEASLASESSLKLIIDTIPAMAWSARPDGAAEFFNQRFLDHLGFSAEQAQGWGWTAAVHPDDLGGLAAIWQALLASGEPGDAEARLRRHDGEYRWFLFRTNPLRDSAGNIVSWYGINTDIEDRKRAEEALRARDQESRLIVDNIPALVSILTPAGGFEFLNRQTQTYTGKTLEELMNWGAGDAVHPDDLSYTVERYTQGIESGEPFEIVYRMRRFDGAYRWFEGRHRPMRDPDGRLVRWFVSMTDIDDRKRAEDALRASERNLKLIIDTIPALAWSARPDGAADFLSQHFLDYVDLSAEQAQDWGWTVAVHPDDLSGLTVTWQSILASGEPGEAEARMRRFDGEYRWLLFRANPLRDETGNIVNWYGLNTDIDDLKRAEEELRRSEAFLADAQRLSRTGSFSWRVNTADVTCSDETYRIYGFDPKTPVTFDLIRTRVHPENLAALQKMTDQARRQGGDFDYETRLVMPDQSVKHVRVFAHSTRNKDGELELRGAVQDVTERRLAEEALSKARSELAHVSRVTSLGALTASIAHEVNQPLAGIITNASTCLRMLAADPPDLDGARATAQRTIRDGNRASDVIRRLRDLFARKPPSMGPVDLNDAAREVLALSLSELRRGRVTVRASFADDLPPVRGDRVQLQQVILNLILNAADAMSGVEDRPREMWLATGRDETGQATLLVRDSGVGIEPQQIERFFDAFYTTKAEGMGIGLSVSRSIIEAHDGRLWATVNDGPGATFAFSIPMAAEQAWHPEGAPSASADAASTWAGHRGRHRADA